MDSKHTPDEDRQWDEAGTEEPREIAGTESGSEEHMPGGESASADGFRMLKSAQSFATAACICSAISLIVGGVVLSTIGLVLGIVSLRKLRKVQAADWSNETLQKARRLSRTGIILGAVALCLNLISLAMVLPIFMEYLNTGDISQLYADFGLEELSTSPSASSLSGGSKTWG